MSRPLRTYDLRLWVTADPPGPALARFVAEVRELAEAHDGIDVRWTYERRDRHGRPRIHPPPREPCGTTDNATGRCPEGGTR